MRRLIGVLVATLAVSLGLAWPGYTAAAPTAASPQVHTYDVQQQPAPEFEHATERGPPSTTTSYTTAEAVDLRSHGSSARLGGHAPGAAFASDSPALLVQAARISDTTSGGAGACRGDSSSLQRRRVAAKDGGALVKYDADFAIAQLTKGGRGTASGLVDLAESQGWKAVQSPGGPLKYFDSNEIERLVIKRGSARTPGSDFPHVAIRNVSGQRVDPYGNPVTRKSPGNHTPITWDLP